MIGRRHTPNEIVSKLQQADSMAAEGRNQKEIARLLGISIMTYHRWRKHRGNKSLPSLLAPPETRRSDNLTTLKIENERLRWLVTDLLLEKMASQGRLEAPNNSPLRHKR